MEIFKKAKILSEAGKYDSCGPKACEVKVDSGLGGIYHAKAEHKTCRLFKTLMSNECKFDCKYCHNSTSCKNKSKIAKYKPDELAKVFMNLCHTLSVEGLFLSSGVSGNVDKITEEMIESVRLLRFKYKFRGYIHFKVLPGTSYELVKQASELSTRMSINLEAPNKSVMSELSSCKDYKIDILRRQAWISKMKLMGGQTSQMIVTNNSTDKDILKMTNWEYTHLELRRMFYAAFRPVKGTPMGNDEAVPLLRQNRLYNVDFLMRKYGYKLKEIDNVFVDDMLPRGDPKLVMAQQTFGGDGIDPNEASYSELIRVPGIGPKIAQKIVNGYKIKKLRDLHALGGSVRRAKPFIIVNGHRQKMLREFR